MLKEKQWILVFSFFVHCVFLVSIFDIYFKSPIVEGVAPIRNQLPAAAKRLVLFVGDGLRADTFFDYNGDEPVAPYLRLI